MEENKNVQSEITDSQLFWYKNKNKFIIGGITLLLLIVFGLGLWFIFSREKEEDKTMFIQDTQRMAEYLITPTEDNKVLLNQAKQDTSKGLYIYNTVDEKEVSKSIYSNSNDLDSLYAMDLSTNKVTIFSVDNAKLSVKEVTTYKGDLELDSFKYHDDILVGISGNYLVVQYKDNTDVITLEKKTPNYLIKDKRVLYANGSQLFSYNVETKNTVSVDLEKDIQDIELINNQVVAMSKFGETKKTSTIASFKVADLYGTGLISINYTDTTALQNSEENVDFYVFSKDDDKNAITIVTIKDEILKVEKTSGTFDNVTENDVGRNGYAYLIKNNKVSVIDVNTGNESGILNIEKVIDVIPAFY